MSRLKIILLFCGMASGLVSCAHLEVWNLKAYVAPSSVEHQRIEARLVTLYQMTCRLPNEGERRFIVNGKAVALMVPDVNAQRCRDAIPYAICEVEPGQNPVEQCTRLS